MSAAAPAASRPITLEYLIDQCAKATTEEDRRQWAKIVYNQGWIDCNKSDLERRQKEEK
jgi:hypothetical protein